MTKYNKLWAALLIGGLFIAMKHYGLVPSGFDRVWMEVLQAALVAWGVYQVPNAQQ